ncbi:MAG: arylsulfatase [Phycisphaeraceae bacterium]
MAEDTRPNILLIMTDQQRGDCLSIEDHPVLQTPYLDHLAGAGARFRKAYTTCPSCVPARRSLMAGQHPKNTGMVGYRDGIEWEAPPPLLPQVMRDHGYQTALIGRRMHLHPHRKRYGFEYQTHTGGADSEYIEWLRQHGGPEEFDYHGAGPTHNDWPARPWPLEEHTHATNWTVTEALKWLRFRDSTAPFFLTVQFLAPHPPLVPPAYYMERYLRTGIDEPKIGDWAEPPPNDGRGGDPAPHKVKLEGEALQSTRAAYYGLIDHVDDQIRRLLRPFMGAGGDKQAGLDNTIIIFTSDHGEMLGDHYMWRKSVPYEASARVPMIVHAPKRYGIERGTVIDEPVCLEDIMPTCLDVAGIDIPESVDGRSLLPLMRGEKPAWREHLHIEHAPQHQTVTDGKEKFIWWVADGQEQLFDLARDSNECHDLIDDPAWQQRAAHWREVLIEELKDRPEGFSDGKQLIAGRKYVAVMEHARRSPWAHLDGERAAVGAQ